MSNNESENKKVSGFLSQLGLGLALGIAVVVCTVIVAKTYVHVKESQNSIQVKGYAEKSIVSENAVWDGTISASNAIAADAYKLLAQVKAKTADLIQKEGYKPDQINWGPINRFDVYKKSADGQHQTNEIERYTVSQTVEIISKDVHKIAQLPSKVNELNLEGFDVNSGNLRFYYPSDKLDALRVELLAAASKSAKERAEQFAVSSGNNIGRLLQARQGVFQVTAPNSSDTSDYGIYDTSSINKVIKIVVTMTYGVKG